MKFKKASGPLTIFNFIHIEVQIFRLTEYLAVKYKLTCCYVCSVLAGNQRYRTRRCDKFCGFCANIIDEIEDDTVGFASAGEAGIIVG